MGKGVTQNGGTSLLWGRGEIVHDLVLALALGFLQVHPAENGSLCNDVGSEVTAAMKHMYIRKQYRFMFSRQNGVVMLTTLVNTHDEATP